MSAEKAKSFRCLLKAPGAFIRTRMETVRIAVAGLGHAGSRYAVMLSRGDIAGAELSAVCSRDPDKAKRFPPPVRHFSSLAEMLRAKAADAVIIATPHADHVPAGMAALEAGLHVLVEKPIAARLREGRKLIEAHRGREGQVFAVVYNMRLAAASREIARRIRAGDLGAVRRAHWTFTDWYRTEAYFRASWRGTWAGEGGGLLINQVIHHLDLLQWWFGMPSQVGARASWGKYHSIEVEDEVVGWWRYANGLMISMVFSTGEAPGVNHLEIVGDRGTMILRGNELVWHSVRTPLPEHRATCPSPDAKPECRTENIRLKDSGSLHAAAIQNFVDAVRSNVPLAVPAAEGLAALEIPNAMQLAAWTERDVALPLDEDAFEQVMESVIERSQKK